MKSDFAKLLLKWNKEENHRSMPWKGEKNPYYIWLSEIILQQTRVEQGLPYFLRFKEKYPTVKHLAEAREDEVMKLWQGLGYYSRARNLHETAKNIYRNYGGKFPPNYEELKKLKGVGDYTASAIASFAFGEKKAVVDGNVIRVLSRVFGISTPFDTTEGKGQFAQLAQELIDTEQPGIYNQAIMDFGALVCVPTNPSCDTCPLRKRCVALTNEQVNELPVRLKRTKITNRYFNYMVISNEKEIFVSKRNGNDIWKNLYELPLIETEKPLTRHFSKVLASFFNNSDFKIIRYSEEMSQLLSHRKIHFRFVHIAPANFDKLAIAGAKRVKLSRLSKLAFPQTLNLYLKENYLL